MWHTLHRKWKNYSGSLQNYEVVSYDWLLKGPFNDPMSLSHHKPDSTRLGKATSFNQTNTEAFLLTMSTPYDEGMSDHKTYTVQTRPCSQLFTNHAKHHAREKKKMVHDICWMQYSHYLICCCTCARKQPSNLSSVSKSTNNRSSEQWRANRHKSGLSFK